jgi:5-formyltetrahydrofolate cyclo-ligase
MTSVSIESGSFGRVLARDVHQAPFEPAAASATPAAAAAVAPAPSTPHQSGVTVSAPFDPTLLAAKHSLRQSMTRTLNALSPEAVAAQSAALLVRVVAHPVYRAASAVALFVSMPSGEVQTEDIIRHALEAGKKVFVPRIEPPPKRKPGAVAPAAASNSVAAAAAADEAHSIEAAPMPALAPGGGRMKLLQIHSMEELMSFVPNRWGIREPPLTLSSPSAGSSSSSPRLEGHDCPELTLLLCPGVAFDRSCRRLGHGKGYYDTYMASLQAHRTSSDAAGHQTPPAHTIALAFDEQLVPEQDQVPVGELDIPLDEILTPSTHIVRPKEHADAAAQA